MPDALPEHASVVVIGGGVMGCSTLYHLAKAGVGDALLIERNKLTSGTTWHSAAQVRALRSTRNMTELIRYSIGLYGALEAETGQATGWIQKGSLSIATTPDRMTHIERQAALAALYGVPARVIGRQEAAARWPAMNAADVIGAVWSPDDGRVSPSDLCAALARGARARGATIREDTAVTGIRTERGRVVGVETTRGTVRTQAVAVCAGLWSRRVAAMGGAMAPLWPCEHYYLLTKPVEGLSGPLPTLSDHDAHLYIRDDSGGLLVGCFEPDARAIAPERLGEGFAFQLLPEDWDHFEPMMRAALHRLPALETAEVKMLLNGPESFTPDGAFLLGEVPETRGLFLGCGMNSVGVATAGGAGMTLAHAITEGATPFDLSEVDPARMAPVLGSAEVLAARAPEILGKHYEIAYPGRQWQSARGLRRSPVHETLAAAGAEFGQAFGWERALHFGGATVPRFGRPDWQDQVAREVAAAHTGAAVFDLSSFGKIAVEGPDAEIVLNRVCANQMARAPGRAIYTQMLSPLGGILSDLTAVRLGDEVYRLTVGTASIRRDMAWLARHGEGHRVTLRDETGALALLALAGPEAARIAAALGGRGMLALGFFRSGEDRLAGVPVRATRLSYVGEAGWEIACAAANAPRLIEALLGEGAILAGTHAQSAMRIEKRFLALGQDIDSDVSPLDAGLGFAVAWDTDFIGRDALRAKQQAGATNRIVTLAFDDRDAVPLGHEPVLMDGRIAGKTTSAAFGHRVGRPLALADLRMAEARPEGVRLAVRIGREERSAQVIPGAAFDPGGARMGRAAAGRAAVTDLADAGHCQRPPRA